MGIVFYYYIEKRPKQEKPIKTDFQKELSKNKRTVKKYKRF